MPHSHLHPWRDIRPFQRHSLVLVVSGLVYIAIGQSYVTTEPVANRLMALQFALKGPLTIDVWGCVFILAGVLAIISARWPPISETWGYTVLTGLSAAWAAFYFVGVVVGDAPTQNISGTLSWGLIGFLWWAISGLINPENFYKFKAEIQANRAEIEALNSQLIMERARYKIEREQGEE